ncbi:hypothetical protein CISIN_1g0046842mg, partial [Citrus sinensis]
LVGSLEEGPMVGLDTDEISYEIPV